MLHYSNSLTYPSLSDMLLLQCPQWGRTPLDVAEFNSKEKAAEVLRKHGAAEDNETILTLSDGTTVPAINLEMILKKNLDAVEHVMVVGSGMNFLSCILTLKTKGSEAAARGEDPASLGPAKDDLSGAALSLAQQHASEATTLVQARTCSKFRGEGLLSLFAKANAEIKLQAQQVFDGHCLSYLPAPRSSELAEVD
jgi:hypothetical protein